MEGGEREGRNLGKVGRERVREMVRERVREVGRGVTEAGRQESLYLSFSLSCQYSFCFIVRLYKEGFENRVEGKRRREKEEMGGRGS